MSAPFRFQQFSIQHDRCAQKVGTDGVLLGAWTNYSRAITMLDVGTGSGLLALMAAQQNHELRIEAVEVEINAAQQAAENALASPWANRIKVHHTALQSFVPAQPFDLIISNPPFFSSSLQGPAQNRNLARHQESLSFGELLSFATAHLSEKGELSVIYPFDLIEGIVQTAGDRGLYLIRRCDLQPRTGKAFSRSMLAFSREAKQVQTETLVIRLESGAYSPEHDALTREFYLSK